MLANREPNLSLALATASAAFAQAWPSKPIRWIVPFPPGAYADLPTMAETFPGFEVLAWQGVMAPAGTPRDVIGRLNLEIRAALEDAEVRQKLVNAGLELAHGSPEDFAALIQKDYAKYSRIIREAGLKAQ